MLKLFNNIFDKTLQKFYEWCKLKIALVYFAKELKNELWFSL